MGFEDARLGHALAEEAQGIALATSLLDFARLTVGHGVAFEMAEVAGQLDVDQAGTAAAARPLDRFAGGLMDREEVVAVQLVGRHAEGRRALGLIAGHRPDAGGRLGIAVVLHHEDRGQVPDLGEIVAFQGGALVGCAVADEGDGDAAGLQGLGGQRGAADQRRAAADDAVGAHHALGQVGDMHRAALAAAQTVAPAEDLGHHAVDVAALGDAVAVAPVGAGDVVAVVQVDAHADGGCFLPGVEMDESGNAAFGKLAMHTLLELADRVHGAVALQKLFAIELHSRFLPSVRPMLFGLRWKEEQPPCHQPKGLISSGFSCEGPALARQSVRQPRYRCRRLRPRTSATSSSG